MPTQLVVPLFPDHHNTLFTLLFLHRMPISTATMEDCISKAEKIIIKWDVHNPKVASLFREDRHEAQTFVSAVTLLKHAMNSFVSGGPSSNKNSLILSRAHKLVDSAMARLQKELHQILATNKIRNDLDSLSSSFSSLSTSTDDDSTLSADERMDDLRSIAECMVTCGYTKECVKVYTTVRHSIVEEGLYRLGHIRQTSSQVHRLNWDAAEKRIKSWVGGSRSAVRTLFAGERTLCDYVFGGSESLKEPIFAGVAKDPAVQFLQFPEMVASKRKSSPEKVFEFLDLYDAISELYPEIESLFSLQSTAAVIYQARASLAKLGEFVRSSLSDFESAIEKDWSKGAVPGGGNHPITRYVMNYLSLLADYREILGEILADHHPFPSQMSLPEPFAELLSPVSTAPNSPSRISEEEPEIHVAVTPPAVTTRVAWLILMLLCKIDGKAEKYNDAALSYLFLANNMRYVVNKVRTSNLRHVLGEEWVRKNGEKAQAFARGYERLAWKKVVDAIPDTGKGGMEKMAEFNVAFEEAYRRQRGWVVTDKWLREELMHSIAGNILAPYREFYLSYTAALRKEKGGAEAAAVRFSPDDIGNYLSDLFYGSPSTSPSGSSRSSGSGSNSGSYSQAGRRSV